MRTLLLVAVCATMSMAGEAAHAGKQTTVPTIAERHAAYHAKTDQLAAGTTRRQRFVQRLKLRGARLLIRTGLSGPFERRANQRGVDEQINAIVTAGELRVSRLRMPKEEVRRDVQSQIDSFRRDARQPGKFHYEVHVPPNALGVE